MLCFSANTSKVKVKTANHIGMEIHASEEHQENPAQFKQWGDIFSEDACKDCSLTTNSFLNFIDAVTILWKSRILKTHNALFACQECHFTSSSEFAFELHTQNDHSPTGKSQTKAYFSCSTCGMIFADEQDLQGHKKRQHTVYGYWNATWCTRITRNCYLE